MALDPDKRMKVLSTLPAQRPRGPSRTAERAGGGPPEAAGGTADGNAQNAPAPQRTPRPAAIADRHARHSASSGPPSSRLSIPRSCRQVAASLPPDALADRPELRRIGVMSRAPQQVVIGDLREAKLYRALYSNAQLEEVLDRLLVQPLQRVREQGPGPRHCSPSYERDAIRPHVLGKFKDLLLATARHPAMLYYLDNWESMSPGRFQHRPFAPARSPPAQQLAAAGARPQRELRPRAHGTPHPRRQWRLHAGRTSSPWPAASPAGPSASPTETRIRLRRLHARYRREDRARTQDPRRRRRAGRPAGDRHPGASSLDRALHLARSWPQRFVADDPPQALVERMAQTFTKTDGDLRAVLETMFTSREFFSEGAGRPR